MATGLGILPSAIDDEPAINIFELMRYWAEEPPTHVILALRYLGQKQKRAPISESEARQQLHELGGVMETGAMPLPQALRDAAQWAEAQRERLNKTTSKKR